MLKREAMSKRHDGHKPQEKKEEQHKQQQGGGKRPNQILYLGRVAWRFYTSLLSEAALGFILIAPFWAFFYLYGLTEVTIPVNLFLWWGIATLSFILQGLMFKRN